MNTMNARRYWTILTSPDIFFELLRSERKQKVSLAASPLAIYLSPKSVPYLEFHSLRTGVSGLTAHIHLTELTPAVATYPETYELSRGGLIILNQTSLLNKLRDCYSI
jgi:hypothetical protein